MYLGEASRCRHEPVFVRHSAAGEIVVFGIHPSLQRQRHSNYGAKNLARKRLRVIIGASVPEEVTNEHELDFTTTFCPTARNRRGQCDGAPGTDYGQAGAAARNTRGAHPVSAFERKRKSLWTFAESAPGDERHLRPGVPLSG